MTLVQNEINITKKKKSYSGELKEIDDYFHLKEQENWKDLNNEAREKLNELKDSIFKFQLIIKCLTIV